MKAVKLARGLAFISLTLVAFAQSGVGQDNPCTRYPIGSRVTEPVDLYSQHGVLKVDFNYETGVDDKGRQTFCFITPDGVQSPTLHVNPGDTLVITLTNLVPKEEGRHHDMPGMEISAAGEGGCGASTMDSSSVNIHWHGTNTPPICHQDEVIHTIINSGETFVYQVHIPKNEPPGLYWYHPHIHGQTRPAVQGGASGAIVVEGIENVNPKVAGLPQRVLLIRDFSPGSPPPAGVSSQAVNGPADQEGFFDLSVNYVPITAPNHIPAEVAMLPDGKEFWRVVNSAAITILDLQFIYDQVPQPIEIIALDGVPIGSQDGNGQGKSLIQDHILLTPAARAEFIVTAPSANTKIAHMKTLKVFTGPGGDTDPTRTLINIKTTEAGPNASEIAKTRIPMASGSPTPKRFPDLAKAKVDRARKLYFSEDANFFYITVEGQTPKPYEMDDPPAIVTRQGSVEDWTIQNRANEDHAFHMHQIHFKLLARDGKTLPPEEQQILDTVNIPHWSGTGPYPSVTLRMDFRGPDVGDFVYHCHLLEHEDGGMMAIIRVLPPTKEAATTSSKSADSSASHKTKAVRKE